MKNRIAPRDHSLPKHGKLMDEINEFSIAVKLHHICNPNSDDPEKLEKAKASVAKPTWENVSELLNKIFRELREDKYNPIKY